MFIKCEPDSIFEVQWKKPPSNNLPNEIDSQQSDESHNAYSQQNAESDDDCLVGIFRIFRDSRTFLHFDFQTGTKHLLQLRFYTIVITLQFPVGVDTIQIPQNHVLYII